MSKANQKARQETVTEGPTSNGHKAPAWPVQAAGDLTAAHVPPRLRDELLAPERAKLQALANAFIEAVKLRNDTLAQVNQVVTSARKDTLILQGAILTPQVKQILVEAGVVQATQGPPGQGE